VVHFFYISVTCGFVRETLSSLPSAQLCEPLRIDFGFDLDFDLDLDFDFDFLSDEETGGFPTKAIGDRWFRDELFPVLCIPSAVVPQEKTTCSTRSIRISATSRAALRLPCRSTRGSEPSFRMVRLPAA